MQASEMRFYEESKELHCLTRCIAMRFENLLTSIRNFFELKHLSLNGLVMQTECLRKGLPEQDLVAKANARRPVGDLELDGPITIRILDRIA